ncbi:MAG: AMP-binding protein [Sphingomicrobium sp.]
MISSRRLALPDFVRLHASGRPNEVALQDAASGQSLSYSELDRRIGAALAILLSLRLQQGDRIAALSRNSVELVILQLACARGGMIFVPLNWRLNRAELQLLIADCEPALIFGDESLELLGSGELPLFESNNFAKMMLSAEPAANAVTSAHLPSLMLYTSGSTGRPKGVLLSELNLLATAVNFSIIGEVTANSAFLVDVPTFHVIGMVTNVRPALMMGGKVVVSRGFDAAVTLERLAEPELAITHYFCVPQIAMMLRSDASFDPNKLRSLRAIFTGGAPHPAENIRQWLDDDILAVDGYGMTEAGTLLGMPLDRALIASKAGSAGLLPPTIEHRITGPSGEPVAPGGIGELLVRGPNLFEGYWRNPDATADAFTADGYFRTGDLVRRDDDGFFFIVDRRKDMFISGGENVYPAEIEAALRSHPEVDEAAVVGVPDPRWGEVGHAFVVLRTGGKADEEELRLACEAMLARYKLPRRIQIIEQMPRTGSGKVAKPELRTMAAASAGEE